MMVDRLQRVAHHCRTGGYGDAASELNGVLQEIGALLSSAGIDEKRRRQLIYSLETVYLMQQQQDWVGLADVVEYELIHLVTFSGGLNTSRAT